MIETTRTDAVLWGTLQRKAPDRWEWIDGTPEPSVQDMTAQTVYDFRKRHYPDKTFVEVPVYAVRGDPNLRWVLDYYTRKGVNGRRIAREQKNAKAGLLFHDATEVYLVPIAAWNRWAKKKVVGAEWDLGQQKKILQKAQKLRQDTLEKG